MIDKLKMKAETLVNGDILRLTNNNRSNYDEWVQHLNSIVVRRVKTKNHFYREARRILNRTFLRHNPRHQSWKIQLMKLSEF